MTILTVSIELRICFNLINVCNNINPSINVRLCCCHCRIFLVKNLFLPQVPFLYLFTRWNKVITEIFVKMRAKIGQVYCSLNDVKLARHLTDFDLTP